MFQEFNESRAELMVALEDFIAGIKKAIVGKLLSALLGLCKSIFNMATGAPPTGEMPRPPVSCPAHR